MRRPAPSYALQVCLGLCAFVAGTLAVRAVAAPPDTDRLGVKLAAFARHRDEYEAVFIGSSRVYRGLDTRLVDAELARAGLALHSFNLAADGMLTFEQDHVLREVLALEPAHLRWVFLESGPLSLTLPEHQPYENDPVLSAWRGTLWHTPRETWAVLRALWFLPLSPARKLALAGTHLELLGRNLVLFGRGWPTLDAWSRGDVERARDERRLEGAHALAGNLAERGPEHAQVEPFAGERESYAAQVARIRAQNALPLALDELDLGFHRAALRLAAEHGVELIHVSPPGAEGNPEALRLHELGRLPTLFQFNEPERCAELFAFENHYDSGHLNRAGVELFSRRFARALLVHLGAADP